MINIKSFIQKQWLLTVLLLSALHVTAQPAAANQQAKDWNVVFFLVDDLGWRDLGYSGSDFHETPNIDKLAKSGMIFTNGYAACTVCSPTRAALMTGMYPARLHLTDFINGHNRKNAKLQIPDWTKYLDHKYTTLAEALKQGGYRTAHVGKWHLAVRNNEADSSTGYPEKHGFEINIGGDEWGAPGSYHYPFGRKNQPGRRVKVPGENKQGDYLTDRLTDEALKVIDQWKDEKFYLNMSYYTVHTPIQGRKDLVEQFKTKVDKKARHQNPGYAAMMKSLDMSVGRIVEKLKQAGIADRTVIFFTGDNGGLSHLRNRNTKITDNSPLRRGKGDTYEGGVRVPTFVVWPGVTQPGSVNQNRIITVDYYPTILELTGVKGNANHNADIDGVSLVNILKNPTQALQRETIYFHYPHYHTGGATPYSALIHNDLKLIEFFEDGRLELYDLKNDVSEKKNLVQSQPERAKSLHGKLKAWRKEVKAQLPTRK